ncbi:MAG TPA: hypothetical protein VFV37_04460, partial [Luteibaculaceae bacterium]|nr:hypothetical protein [Luteibaculaceae bacterium]
ESNGKLDMANFNLNGANRRAGQIFVDNNGVLSLSTATNFPAHLVSGAYAATMAPSAIVEYRLTANSSVMTAAFNYPIVKLYGNVTKTVGAINNTTIKVNEIQLLEGTMQFSPGVPLVMNNALSKRVIISAGTFVEVQQDFSALDANFSIHPTSTFSYTENGSDQRVYGLKNTSGQFEPYGNLTFLRRDGLGNYKRDIAANDIVKILGKLSVASNGRLNVNQNAILEFSSNATYTGYLAAVPTSFQFNYLGNPVGKAVVRKYIALPAANYRDFTSPIKGVTLRSFQNAGLRMTGFPGSQFPTFSFKNAYKYNEAVAGHFNQGFYPATSIDNPIVTMEGTKLTSAGWRVYAGSNAGVQFTLSDTGLFNIGDIVYKLGFTAGGTDRLNDDGWNFIGNPYPCPISWTKIANDPSNALLFTNKSLRPAVYMWRPADTGVPNDPEDSYSFFNSFTGVSSHAFETNIIPANQGFWLKAYSATSNNTSFDLTIKESHKVDQQASAFYKSQGVDYNKLKLSLKLTQGNRTDQIWAHPFPEANEGHDVLFDIARFGEITDGPNLNFTLNAESMNCWVNAFSDKQAETQLPLEVFTPKAGTATFAISNVAQLLETFGCISITDVFTGLTFPVVADTAIEFESTPAFRGVRFILNIKRSLVSAVETSDAICFDDNNGKLEIDLTGLANEVDFTLLRNGVVFDSIVGPAIPVSLNLGRGNYTLVNNRGLISCLSNSFNFTIESYPEVISSFSAPAEWRQNQFIPIENTSIGASSQLWRFSDGFVTAAKNPLYFFDTPGLYTISLESKNEFECSGGEVTREIQILNTTGIGNQAAPENTSVNSASDGIQVFIGGADQTWNTTVTDAAGRMLWSGKLSSGVHNTLPVYPNQQILILSAKGSEKSWAIRLMH